MCGRYGLWTPEDDLAQIFGVDFTIGDARPTFNAAPSQLLPVVFERFEDAAGGSDTNGDSKGEARQAAASGNKSDEPKQAERVAERRMQLLTWGLVPHWAKDSNWSMINARSETILEKPSFKASARRQRCLVPANGYYEWQDEGGRKQPWFLSRGEGDPVMGFAGIYSAWKSPNAKSEDELWLRTFAIITRSAPDALGYIHDRSPVVVPEDMWDDWLDPGLEEDAKIQQLLDAIPAPNLQPRKVGKAVGNVRNNDPSLVEPIE